MTRPVPASPGPVPAGSTAPGSGAGGSRTDATVVGGAAVPAGRGDGARARDRRLWAAMLAVALLAALAAGLGAGVRSTYGGYAAVDEPEYLLTALSLAEDHDLDISDELRDRRYLDFHDADLPVQTSARPDGSRLSPHDPLLPLLLAVPVGLGGWLAAKLTLAALAGVLAALTVWVAVRRFAVPLPAGRAGRRARGGQRAARRLRPAGLPGAAGGARRHRRRRRPHRRPPDPGDAGRPRRRRGRPALAVGQVRPGGGRARRPRPGPAAARRRRAAAAVLAGVLAGGAVGYAAVHRAVWGGWTVYASGDHFERSGEFGVVGVRPDYAGRTTRLLGLLVDRDFGLAAWQPGWLLLVPAVAALLAARPRGWTALAVPLAAGWATATWVALTMHGFWWPGRQLVVVLPLAVLVILCWLARLRRPAVLGAAALAAAGVAGYATLLVTGYAGDTTWVLAPDELALHRPAGLLLPDDRDLTALDRAKYAGWLVAAGVAAGVAALAAARRAGTGRDPGGRRRPRRAGAGDAGGVSARLRRAAPTRPTTGPSAGRATAASRR